MCKCCILCNDDTFRRLDVLKACNKGRLMMMFKMSERDGLEIERERDDLHEVKQNDKSRRRFIRSILFAFAFDSNSHSIRQRWHRCCCVVFTYAANVVTCQCLATVSINQIFEKESKDRVLSGTSLSTTVEDKHRHLIVSCNYCIVVGSIDEVESDGFANSYSSNFRIESRT
jgi:hypothetical protein